MKTLNAKKFGIAIGLTCSLFYLGCALLMLIVGTEGTIKFFNTLLHGMDVTTFVRMDIPVWESIIGLVVTFILGWLFGVCLSLIYNAQINTDQ